MGETCDRFEMEAIAEDRQLLDDDSSEFSDFDGSKHSINSSSESSDTEFDSDDMSNSSSSTLKFELQKQNSLKNNLSIVGIPEVRGENLYALFFKICKLLGAQITRADIKSIRRDTFRAMIIVELRDYAVKSHICRYSHAIYLWSDDVVRSPSGIMRSRIYINDQMTYFYKVMWEIGRAARKQNLIHTSWITDHGFMVKRTKFSKKQRFLSAQQLSRFIDSIQKAGKQQKKRKYDMNLISTSTSKRRRIN